MYIGIAGPLGTPDIEHLLEGDTNHLPREMSGSSLLVTLIEELIAKGHHVVAFTTDPELLPRRKNRVQALGRNFKICYVPRRRHGLRMDRGAPGRMLDLFRLERQALADAIREEQPDIIHAHWSYEFAAAALDTGLPCLVTCHDSPWAILRTMPDLYRVGRLLMARSVLRRTRHATVVSPYLIDELRKMTKASLSVVPNPLPNALFEKGKCRATNKGQSHSPQIAMILNGWTSIKNPQAGMLAMEEVRKTFPDARMHLFGPDYGIAEHAWSWASKHGLLNSFIFHGRTPHLKTMEALAQMDLLLHPASEESFGMTIAEAMALGIPVVAGERSGAIPWVLGAEDAGGILVDIKSPPRIADAILKIFSNPELYEKCANNGQKRAIENFSARAITDAYLEQYSYILRCKK